MARKPSTPKAPVVKAPGAPSGNPPSNSDAPTVNPLASAAGRKWLEEELVEAERDERLGPAGLGWSSNEALRAKVTERVEFLRALIATLPAAI
jgi:hypothetical protein